MSIRGRLTQRLGSPELAGDALQDAWVKIARRCEGDIRNPPRSYILSVAMNAARDRMHDDDHRYLTGTEIDSLLDVPQAPDPARVAEGRSEPRQLGGRTAGAAKAPPRNSARGTDRQASPAGNCASFRYLSTARREGVATGRGDCLARRGKGARK